MNEQFLPCLCLATKRTSNILIKYYDKYLKKFGITISQYSIMMSINSVESTNITDLAKNIHLSKSTLTRDLAPLIESGLIHSARGANRREIILSLTEKGNDVITEAFYSWKKVQKDLTDYLGGEKKAWEYIKFLLNIQKLSNNQDL